MRTKSTPTWRISDRSSLGRQVLLIYIVILPLLSFSQPLHTCMTCLLAPPCALGPRALRTRGSPSGLESFANFGFSRDLGEQSCVNGVGLVGVTLRPVLRGVDSSLAVLRCFAFSEWWLSLAWGAQLWSPWLAGWWRFSFYRFLFFVGRRGVNVAEWSFLAVE